MTAHLITLGDIRAAGPCGIRKNDTEGWALLLRNLGQPHGKPDLTLKLSIGDVLISNGLDDALWCLQCLLPRVAVSAIMPAVKRASTHTKDQRVHDCIAALDRWRGGEDVDLQAAAAWARAAALTAEDAWAARAAADAAWAAADAAAVAAARAAVAAAVAAADAQYAERDAQRADLLTMFPPVLLGKDNHGDGNV